MDKPNNSDLAAYGMTRKRVIKTMDWVVYILGPLGNIAVIPQIIKAWQSDAPGMAIATWVLFVVIGFIWLAYAMLHNLKPLIVAQAVGISCNLLVVGGWMFNQWIV